MRFDLQNEFHFQNISENRLTKEFFFSFFRRIELSDCAGVGWCSGCRASRSQTLDNETESIETG